VLVNDTTVSVSVVIIADKGSDLKRTSINGRSVNMFKGLKRGGLLKLPSYSSKESSQSSFMNKVKDRKGKNPNISDPITETAFLNAI